MESSHFVDNVVDFVVSILGFSGLVKKSLALPCELHLTSAKTLTKAGSKLHRSIAVKYIHFPQKDSK